MGKKYRLAKDLPFAKKGSKVERRHNDELGIYFWYVYNQNSDEWWQLGYSLLIDSSYIEGVKPREFFIDIDNPKNTNCYNAIEISSGSVNEFGGWLKVREVLE